MRRDSLGIWEDADRAAGHGTEALRLILTHSFDHLDLHCIELRVLARNAAAICCYWKCGFVEEERERHTASLEGEWQDDLVMSVLAEEFQGSASTEGASSGHSQGVSD